MTRQTTPIRWLLGPPGSSRRRRLRTIPLVGVVLTLARGLSRRVRQRLRTRRAAFSARHSVSTALLTRQNTRESYDRVYDDDRLLGNYLAPERLAFYKEVGAISARFSPRSVIDVGCGAGNLLHELAARAAPERVVGIDHAGAGIRRASELLPSGEFFAASLYDIDLDETFDLVLCTEVLEHLSDPETAVERLVDLCAASGTIVITVPDGATDSWDGHLNFWSDAELEAFLGRYGDVEVTRLGSNLLAVLKPA